MTSRTSKVLEARVAMRRRDFSDVARAGADGLTWTDSAGRAFVRSLAELADWLGNRTDAGRLPPPGFPKSNRFEPG